MRTFETGATRDKDDHKNDYEGFLSPLVLRAYGDYMQRHRVQADGGLRASDNWQRGMGKDTFAKSLWRHFLDFFTIHRGWAAIDFDGKSVTNKEALCGILFNAMGYLHEMLVEEINKNRDLTEKANIAKQFKDGAPIMGSGEPSPPHKTCCTCVSEESHCADCLVPHLECRCK